MFPGVPKHHGGQKVPYAKGNSITIGVGHCIVIRFGPSYGVKKKVQFFFLTLRKVKKKWYLFFYTLFLLIILMTEWTNDVNYS